MKLIERSDYLNKIINVIGTPDIKVITGVRRSGKSKLLEAFNGYILANNNDANIIHINFNLPEFDELTEYRHLYNYINKQYKDGMDNFVMIDEIQMCTDFEKAINGLHASELLRLKFIRFPLPNILSTLTAPICMTHLINISLKAVCPVRIYIRITKQNTTILKRFSIHSLLEIYVQNIK